MTLNRILVPILFALLAGYSAHASAFGLFPRYFDIAWQEEVQLGDGRVILVGVKQTYVRRGAALSRYDDVTLRKTELNFDAGQGRGRIKFASRLSISLLDQVGGDWYIVLYGQGPYGNYPDEMPSHWGHDFTTNEERLAKLKNGQFVPVAWEEAPTGAILKMNLGPGVYSVESLASLDGKTVTLEDKRKFKTLYPPGPGGNGIARPLRMKPKQE
jgi:hypothetical protein